MKFFSFTISILFFLFSINLNCSEIPESRSKIEKNICYNLKNLELSRKQDICIFITKALVGVNPSTLNLYEKLKQKLNQYNKLNETLKKLELDCTVTCKKEYEYWSNLKKEIEIELIELNTKLKPFFPKNHLIENLEIFILENISFLKYDELVKLQKDYINFKSNSFEFNIQNFSLRKELEKKIEDLKKHIQDEKNNFDKWSLDNQVNNGDDSSKYQLKLANYLKNKQKAESQINEYQMELSSIKKD